MDKIYKMKRIHDLLNIVVRVLFTGHVFLCIWTMVNVHSEPRYWYHLLVFGFLQCLEGWVTFKASKSGGWKWFCPSVFLYIVNVLPYLWMLEVDLLSRRQINRRTGEVWCDPQRPDNQTLPLNLYPLKGKINGPTTLSEWALMLEYTLLLLLIVGRWLLPKGDISRDQLSQLLLVFIGIASDILEFITEGIRTDEITCDFTMVVVILAVWAWSLIQFALTLTLKDTKDNMGGRRKRQRWYALCCGSEIWAIVVTVLVQDGPYFVVRLYIMVEYQVTNQLMLFFTAKNALVLILQMYRVLVVCGTHRKNTLGEVIDNDIKAMSDANGIHSQPPSPYPSPYPSPFPSPYHLPSKASTGLNNDIIIPVSIMGSGSLMEDENGSVWLEPNRDLKKSNLEKWPAILNIDSLSQNNNGGLLPSYAATGSLRSLQGFDNPAFDINLRSGSF